MRIYKETMKRAVLIFVGCFGVTLALIFGARASADALAVVVGVILGVAASVPATFFVTYLLIRPRPGLETTQPSFLPHQPPVVVINTTDKPGLVQSPALPAFSNSTPDRRWTMIGDE